MQNPLRHFSLFVTIITAKRKDGSAMREITKIMKGWEFTGPDGTTTTVDLPHT